MKILSSVSESIFSRLFQELSPTIEGVIRFDFKVVHRMRMAIIAVKISAIGNAYQIPSIPMFAILGKIRMSGVINSTHLKMARMKAERALPIAW